MRQKCKVVLIYNKEFTGNVQTNDDVDYYKIINEDRVTIRVQFGHQFIDSGSTSWIITILSENDKLISKGCYGNEGEIEIDVNDVKPGTYYIKVEPYYFINDDYKICIY